MARGVTISSGAIPHAGRLVAPLRDNTGARRGLVVFVAVAAAFALVGGQLVRLALNSAPHAQSSMTSPIATGIARPDLVDRKGRLLASDVEVMSLYADPLLVIDRDEVGEKLVRIFPDLDTTRLRQTLADRSRRFVWVRRGLSPETAQRVHNLGLPGLAFRTELRRAYPGGSSAGHVLGGVNIDNRGVAGIERWLDDNDLVDSVVAASPTSRRPVALSLDLGVQHALEVELATAVGTYEAAAAAGVVLNVASGEVLASASLPGVDPAVLDARNADAIDRVAGGTFELGSIFKLLTVAEALDAGRASSGSIVDVTEPLVVQNREIKDPHPAGRPLTVAEIFVKSSNVGAAKLALLGGADAQSEFLSRIGVTRPLATEIGAVAEPQVPKRWDELSAVTVSYGHGIAVAPLQFAATAAAMVNGGEFLQPTFLKRGPSEGEAPAKQRVVSEATSRALRELMQKNVAEPGGTGRRADAPGYRVGGKTGTAEIAKRGRYDGDAVIASFVAAFPIEQPKYLTLVMLFEPSRTAASHGEITAGQTAAPVTARLVSRIAPLLGVVPVSTARGPRP